MKRKLPLPILACLVAVACAAAAQETSPKKAKGQKGAQGQSGVERPKPALADVSYGPDESNVYDFWRAPAGAPVNPFGLRPAHQYAMHV